jgi:hypothetical protein
MKGLSDSNLQDKWRKAVSKNFNDCCFFCGQHKFNVPLEAHHLVKRKMLLLKHDWRNGLLVCKCVCHNYAETPTGKAKIAKYLQDNNLLDYLQERSGQCKDWFVKNGITRRDFLKSMYDDLQAKLNG